LVPLFCSFLNPIIAFHPDLLIISFLVLFPYFIAIAIAIAIAILTRYHLILFTIVITIDGSLTIIKLVDYGWINKCSDLDYFFSI